MRVIRRMKGGSQSHLVEGNDGNYYIAKFTGNPQGNRTLINEWVCSSLLGHLGMTIPNLRILELPTSLHTSHDLYFVSAHHRTHISGIRHFGCQCPVDPETTAIFDFLPDRLLKDVGNLAEYGAMFAFDQWVGQTDFRQAVFVRDKSIARTVRFRGYFVDHGMAFAGAQWEFRDQLGALPFQSGIITNIDLRALAQAAVVRIEALSEKAIANAGEGIPTEWFAPGDRECLAVLLTKLWQRITKLLPLIVQRFEAMDAQGQTSFRRQLAGGF